MNEVEDSQPPQSVGIAGRSRYAGRMRQGLALLTLALTAAATPHKVVRSSNALDFKYQWSAEAAAIPALDLRLYKEAKAALSVAQKDAREGQALAREQKRDFISYDYSMTWTTVGETPRLLSLASDLGSFEGGAHPNSNYGSLLWDRPLNRAVGITALFTNANQFSAVTRASYCKRLDAERAKRRQGEKLGGEFDQCPKYSELAVFPADKNRNGRFDRITFVASPYVAGPYVEGEYEISLPVSSALIAAMNPEYRSSFEVQRQ
jgi:hypothetical protein